MVIVEDVSPKKKNGILSAFIIYHISITPIYILPTSVLHRPAPRTPSPPVLLSDDDNPFDERSHKPLTPSLTKKLKSVCFYICNY